MTTPTCTSPIDIDDDQKIKTRNSYYFYILLMDAFLQFERIQVLHDYGNYHLFIQDASDEEMQAIGSHIDVEKVGRWKELGEASINGVGCVLGALEENFAENLNIRVIDGRYPAEKNEIMLEQWALERIQENLQINDSVEISFADGRKRKFVVSGVFNDLGNMKAKGVPGVLLSPEGAAELMPEIKGICFVLFKSGVKIIQAEKEIKDTLQIAADRIGRNERLLADRGILEVLTGQI